MFDIREDNTIEAAKEVIPLAAVHYAEVEEKAPTVPFNINWMTIEALIQAGILSLVVARVDGVAVGYFANLITEDFMTSQIEAKELALYIDPKYRHGKLFIKLMKVTEDVLRSRGIKTQYITFKAGHNTHLPLKLGFTHTETTYQKVLEESWQQ